MLRPEPRPEPSSSAMATHGRRQRSTSRDATIPTTPGCQPSPATTIAAWLAWGRQAASGFDARTEAEAERVRGQLGGGDAGDRHERAQPGLAGARKREEALANDPPVLSP